MSDILARFANAGFHMMKSHHLSPKEIVSFVESFRPNQIKCKQWLVDEISNIDMNWHKVLVVGSWNSCLLYELLQEKCSINYFDFLDSDPMVHKHRDMYFNANSMEKNYSNIIMNAEDFSDFDSYDLIINTSCEHMDDIPAVYGPTYALQSNDYRSVREHINCVDSIDQLMSKNNINGTYFKGSKKMENYKRFMVIGYYY